MTSMTSDNKDLSVDIYNKIKNKKDAFISYQSTYDAYYQNDSPYIVSPLNNNYVMQCIENDNMLEIIDLKKVFTYKKIKNELLTYNLINHIPEKKILLTASNCHQIIKDMKKILDTYSPIIYHLLEDKVWNIDRKNTMNYAIPKNSIIFSNTTSIKNSNSPTLHDHLKMIIKFFYKLFEIKSIKYSIIKDSKYDMFWVIILVKDDLF